MERSTLRRWEERKINSAGAVLGVRCQITSQIIAIMLMLPVGLAEGSDCTYSAESSGKIIKHLEAEHAIDPEQERNKRVAKNPLSSPPPSRKAGVIVRHDMSAADDSNGEFEAYLPKTAGSRKRSANNQSTSRKARKAESAPYSPSQDSGYSSFDQPSPDNDPTVTNYQVTDGPVQFNCAFDMADESFQLGRRWATEKWEVGHSALQAEDWEPKREQNCSVQIAKGRSGFYALDSDSESELESELESESELELELESDDEQGEVVQGWTHPPLPPCNCDQEGRGYCIFCRGTKTSWASAMTPARIDRLRIVYGR